mmetsp:Transcript_18279/g.43991  ORF Transcript_18279/g.43991 Transcript_18279/m.43991 type:complete len:100 (-) Transcript_18279:158-457(-)
MSVSRFMPLLDRVLVQRIQAQAQTASGIYLPDAAKKTMNHASVVAVGPGRRSSDGNLIPMNVAVGDKVVIPEYGGQALKFDDEEYHVFRDEDIVGKLDE